MNWLELSGVGAAWATLAAGYGYWRHQQASSREERQAEALADLRAQMTREHDAVLSQMTRERDSITAQIKDIVNSLGDGYVGRREYDVAMRGFSDSIVGARKEIGAVSVQIGSVQSRVDELFTKVEFRKAPR